MIETLTLGFTSSAKKNAFISGEKVTFAQFRLMPRRVSTSGVDVFDLAAGLVHDTLLYLDHRFAAVLEEWTRIYAHVDHQNDERRYQADLTGGQVGQAAVLVIR